MRKICFGLLTLGLVAAATAACSSGGSTSTAGTAFTVTASETADGNYKYDGLATTANGGIVELTMKNAGKEGHDLQIIKIDGDHTIAEVIALFASADSSAGTPAFFHGAGGVGEVGPGQTGNAKAALGPGTYAFVCTDSNQETGKSHAANGMAAVVKVTGGGSPSIAKSGTVITAKDYSYDVPALKAGANPITFTNSGKEIHHLVALPIAAGKTLDDVKTALASQGPPTGPPPFDFEKATGTAALDAGGTLSTTLNLVPGKYAFLCFINDRSGGPPHFTKGMIQEVTIT